MDRWLWIGKIVQKERKEFLLSVECQSPTGDVEGEQELKRHNVASWTREWSSANAKHTGTFLWKAGYLHGLKVSPHRLVTETKEKNKTQ